MVDHRIQPELQLFLGAGRGGARAAMRVGQAGAAKASIPNIGVNLCSEGVSTGFTNIQHNTQRQAGVILIAHLVWHEGRLGPGVSGRGQDIT